jgi:nitrate reductase (NAD(P)H)
VLSSCANVTESTQSHQFVVNGEVYDATTYLNDHPGGPDSIFLVAGQDASEDFMAIHSSDAKKKLAEVSSTFSQYLMAEN